MEPDEQRDVLGELEITARLMITGGEDKEEARMTRADRSLIRQCILDAAERCHGESAEKRTVLTRDVRDALRARGNDSTLPEMRRVRLLEMADAMDMFCQGTDGEMFDRDGTPWPEADITLVDLATYAREGYNAQLSIAYISLISTVNNIAERDQYLGRPIINVTDEGHIITKNPLLAPYVVKITKMWRKLGAWFWLATQNIDDLPRAAEPMLNMIEWCLSSAGRLTRRCRHDAQTILATLTESIHRPADRPARHMAPAAPRAMHDTNVTGRHRPGHVGDRCNSPDRYRRRRSIAGCG